MVRQIIAIIAGYLVFAVSSVLLFWVLRQPPHQDASASFKLLTLVYGFLFSILSGWVTQFIAAQQKLGINYALAIVIFLLAALSLLFSGGSHWTQLFAMLIFAPASVYGGYLRMQFYKAANRR